jgi:hypothetical protein
MTELQRYLAEEVAEDHADGIITRREAVRRLGLLGVAGGAAAAMLAAHTAQAGATPPPARRRRHGGMAKLEFDPIATQIGDQEVVSFLCYVSEPLSEEGRYCLVLDSWYDNWVLVDKDDVVASISGTTRADGKSVVWVRRHAVVEQKNGITTDAWGAALDIGVEEAKTMSGSNDPPPVKHPR